MGYNLLEGNSKKKIGWVKVKNTTLDTSCANIVKHIIHRFDTDLIVSASTHVATNTSLQIIHS